MKIHKLIILLCLTSTLSGCLAVAAGGTAGYLVAKDKGGVGTYTSDSVITSKLKTKYLTEGDIDSLKISVSTTKSVVSLAGVVPSQKMKNLAVKLARQTSGVKGVNASSLSVSGH